MIGRLALRSLTAHPLRSAILAAGFGAGVGVMAILLGVAEVVLDQARAPALVGGGDVLIRASADVPARLLLSGTLQADGIRERVRVASPRHEARLFVRAGGTVTPVIARGGIPSLERALEDEEIAQVPGWRDTPEDVSWTQDSPEKMLRYIDRFHEIPDAPEWADSWAEWLYFNGRGKNARFYLTFLVGPRTSAGMRSAGVRLQLERGGVVESFTGAATLAQAEVMRAPDLTIGLSSVRLRGLEYVIHLDLRGAQQQRVTGDLTLRASAGRLVPPIEIAGARGWQTGYVVPVMSGRLDGTLTTGGETLSFENGAGYHDHNWGFWKDVSWQWGQAQSGELSVIYGRVFPPAEAADPERIPGFVGVLGPRGPLGYATDVTITETNEASGAPSRIVVQARGTGIEVDLRFAVQSSVITRMAPGGRGSGLDFLQLRGDYEVSGRAGGQSIRFSAPGSAETFRQARPEAIR